MTEDGVVPAQNGPPRWPNQDSTTEPGSQRDAATTLHPADLSVALRAAVAGIGVSGPPTGGLNRVRRKARIRQRNRAVLAGTAGVLVILVGVSVATGGRLSLVPSLTGVVGLGNGGSGGQSAGGQSSQNPSAAGESSRPVWPWGGPSSSATGPAIGPGAPPTIPPSSPGATRTPLCTAATLGISTSLGATVGAIRYGEIDVTAQTACIAADPPMLMVTNGTGTAAALVQILPADQTAAPGLPDVTADGTTMELQPAESYEFQFAWVASACPQATDSPSAPDSTVGSPSATTYTLQYAVPGTGTVPGVTLEAACGAQVYVTDVYLRGAFPTPTPTPTPTTPPTQDSPPPPPPTTPADPPTSTVSPDASMAATDPPSSPDSAKVVPVPVAAVSAGKK
jgi:hypothetical protein